ncbi:unnamed protein product [Phytomonas sp. EM1]|nr:unnamed protein product [Phytomonas sp. EM1]|eukprot:CCW65490.1 unnamed protein product [Phytomonas sp. isolate EM1]
MVNGVGYASSWRACAAHWIAYPIYFLIALALLSVCVDGDEMSEVMGKLLRYAHVKTVFDLDVGEGGEGFSSTRYVLCGRANATTPLRKQIPHELRKEEERASTAMYDSDAFLQLASVLCGVDVTADAVFHREVVWNTLLAPGVMSEEEWGAGLRDLSPEEVAFNLMFRCASFICKDAVDNEEMGEGKVLYGGLSPAFPCGTSSNDTLLLLFTPWSPVVVQSDAMNLNYMDGVSQRLLEQTFCVNIRHSNCQASSRCLLRLTDSRAHLPRSTPSLWHGDGGLHLPVHVAICGHDTSDVVSTKTANLLSVDYTLLLTTTQNTFGSEDVRMMFPKELILSILGWLSNQKGGGGSLLDSLNAGENGPCWWRRNNSARATYGDGVYMECYLPSQLIGRMPPLELTIRQDHVLRSIDSNNHNVPCTFTVDLNHLLHKDLVKGKYSLDRPEVALRIYSSGSYSEAIEQVRSGEYHEPPIVLWMSALAGATYGFTRNVTEGGERTVLDHLIGLPMLYLGAHRHVEDARNNLKLGSQEPRVCVPAKTCKLDFFYYKSLNLCVNLDHKGSFIYDFHTETLTSSLNKRIVILVLVMGALIILGEVVLLCLRRHVNRAKKRHMKLIAQVQGGTNGVSEPCGFPA